ncbi:MAG: 3-methylornithyl-N6-L-lysine dehydrogenase PylD [bacterium]|nr:3-methylornithyl-N6-L-lysine dehydrogenase PylD [bacterium]
MTRLQSHDILDIASQLSAYDDELLFKTGHNLWQIACHAAQLKEADVRGVMSRIRVGVVPIRWGQGVIEGFCEATAGILKHLGLSVFVTGQSDIAGLAEAYEANADVVFLSDDNDFVALNAETRQYVHNAHATGKGFAAGLALMGNGLIDNKVLVLGCGAVGRSAISTLLSYGAKVSTYDVNSSKCREFKSSMAGPDSAGITVEPDLHDALAGHILIVEATNAAGIIRAEDISPQTFIAAPGMPLGLSRDAQNKFSDRLIHDPLQIGVATMGMEVVKQIERLSK